MKAVHRLKSWPDFFQSTLDGVKTHDLRRCDDRSFNVGENILLQEFDPIKEIYTGRELLTEITYITSSNIPCALSKDALKNDFCILSITSLRTKSGNK